MTWICLYSASEMSRVPYVIAVQIPKSAGCSSLLRQVKSPLLVLEMSQVSFPGVNLSNFSGSGHSGVAL